MDLLLLLIVLLVIFAVVGGIFIPGHLLFLVLILAAVVWLFRLSRR